MLTAFFSWWYGEGWKRQVSRVSNRMAGLLDTFSFDSYMVFAISANFCWSSSGAYWRTDTDNY